MHRLSIGLISIILLICSNNLSAYTITFPDACAPGNQMTIAAVGDVLLHLPLQQKAVKQGFKSLWQSALPYIQKATIAYANLEGPMAEGIAEDGEIVKAKGFNTRIYSSYPRFNYQPNLAFALRDSGFDVVSTANNHALDRFAIGIDKTIAALNLAGLQFVGTRSRHSNTNRVTLVQKGNWKIAWISCTEMTNGIDDNYQQVLHCYRPQDKNWLIKTIKKLNKEVDAVIVAPHWGNEYETYPTQQQRLFARQVLDAGATAVIGSHPHVLQPIEKYFTHDGRATLIAYSLGNFVSYQGSIAKRSTIILLLGLTKTNHGTIINGVKYVPMYMQNRNNHLYLSCLLQEQNQAAMNFITSILPSGNILFTGSEITNPECINNY